MTQFNKRPEVKIGPLRYTVETTVTYIRTGKFICWISLTANEVEAIMGRTTKKATPASPKSSVEKSTTRRKSPATITTSGAKGQSHTAFITGRPPLKSRQHIISAQRQLLPLKLPLDNA
jgi:hypothetical protein